MARKKPIEIFTLDGRRRLVNRLTEMGFLQDVELIENADQAHQRFGRRRNYLVTLRAGSNERTDVGLWQFLMEALFNVVAQGGRDRGDSLRDAFCEGEAPAAAGEDVFCEFTRQYLRRRVLWNSVVPLSRDVDIWAAMIPEGLRSIRDGDSTALGVLFELPQHVY